MILAVNWDYVLAVAVPSLVGAVLVFLASKRRDKVTESVGIMTDSAQGTAVAIDAMKSALDGYKDWVVLLQGENRLGEVDLRRCAEVTRLLREENAYWEKKYGNGDSGPNA